jgi:hypothetical protein
MLELDLTSFIWNKDHKDYIVMALVAYRDEVLVVYRESTDRSKICVDSVGDFCKDFQATYQLV